MRAIHLAPVGDKIRPVVVLTDPDRGWLLNVTVAPITSTVRGWTTEVSVGPEHGLEHDSVVSCDNIQTIPRVDLLRRIGQIDEDVEARLATAVGIALNFNVSPVPDV